MTMDDWYMKDATGNLAPHAPVYKNLISDVMGRKSATPPCTCNSQLIPKSPCNVFRRPVTNDEYNAIKNDWDYVRREHQALEGIPSVTAVQATLAASLGRPPYQAEIQDERQVNHLVPKSAGGCPTGDGNLENNRSLCEVCRGLDKRFGDLQSRIPR